MDHQRRLWFKPLIMTTYYTGMRLSEVVNLLWSDVDLRGNDPHDPHDHGYVYVTNTEYNTTKSGQERVIPIRRPLKPWLEDWHERLGHPKDGFAFPSATGLHGFHGMSKLNVSKVFKEFVRKAEDVPNTITFHGLRHSCATDLLRKNVQIHIVQKIMGHSSVDVTQIYEHLDENDLKNALAGID